MSLISFFKTKLRQFAPGQRGKPQPEPGGVLDAPASALDQGMPIEVMKDFDAVLFFGRLAASDSNKLTIERIPGEQGFPVCRVGSAVLVRGYDAGMSPVLLLGRVVDSTGSQCMVGGLKPISYETPRKSVRYPLTPPAGICVVEDAALNLSQPCRLLNISTSGACIVTEQAYQVDRPLQLQVQLTGGPGNASVYPCRVVRAAPRGGGFFEYGLLFTRLDKAGRGRLLQDIKAIRRRTEQKLLL